MAPTGGGPGPWSPWPPKSGPAYGLLIIIIIIIILWCRWCRWVCGRRPWVRQLRRPINTSVASWWHWSLPLQCLRTLSEDQRRQSTAVQAAVEKGWLPTWIYLITVSSFSQYAHYNSFCMSIWTYFQTTDWCRKTPANNNIHSHTLSFYLVLFVAS